MTREEQIRNAADEHFAHSWCGSVKDAFAEGAKWADQHPKPNLVDIDEVCEWIEKLMITSGNYDAYDMQENLRGFKKAMKGE